MAHVDHSVTHVLRRLSPRRAWDRVLDFVDEHDLGRTIGVLALLAGIAGALVAVATWGGGERASPPLEPPAAAEPEPSPFVNRAGGYGFMVPEGWDVREDGRETLAVSPTGRIVVSFGLGAAGEIEAASAQLLESMRDTQSDRQLVGRTWDSIGGARSLLVSGTADESGRSVRFLAITVRGRPRNYAITISVPASSDPDRILPRLERLVTSFEILYPTTDAVR